MWKTFGLACLSVFGVLTGLELLLQLLPVSSATLTGYHVNPLILSVPPGHRWTTSTGWDLRNAQRLQANNMGFVAKHDFVHEPNSVALIGDSYIEASMLDAADRPDAQLERALGAVRPVYAMGGPGSSLLDYAERIRWANREFGVRDAVLMLERGDVRQALCGSGNVHAACLDGSTLMPRIEKLPDAGAGKRWVRRSALAQYAFSQLKATPGAVWQHAVDQARPAEAKSAQASNALPSRPPDHRMIDAVVERFFARIEGQLPGHLVLVMDSDRRALAAGRPIDDRERQYFMQKARERGAVVVDTLPVFQAHLRQSPLTLDVGPYDGHLNPLGVHLAMSAAAEAIGK